MTTADAAAILGCQVRQVQRWCRALGYAKAGRDYQLDPRQLDEIRRRRRPSPGNPNWSR